MVKLIAGICLTTLLVAQASAQSCGSDIREALTWLQKMSLAWDQQSYQGVMTLQRGDDMQVIQVSHTAGDQGATEFMTALTGKDGNVKRVDHPLHCVHPGQQLLRVIGDGSADSCGIAQYYSLLITPGERVAGRPTIYLHIKPKDVYRYGHLMALDNDTGLLLKAQTMARSGRALERFQFASLQLEQETAPSELEPETVQKTEVSTSTHASGVAIDQNKLPSWAPRWLPAGFVLTDTPDDEARLTYTDGMAVFSVFLDEIVDPIVPGEGVVRYGSTISYTRGVSLGNQGVLVTVVGEVPVNTARMVADSVVGR